VLFRDVGIDVEVTLPIERADRVHIFNQFVIRARHRDALKTHLDQAGIGSEIYYPVPFHLQPCFHYLGYRQGDFPESEAAALETLAIPIYGELTPEQQADVVDVIGGFVREAAGMVRSPVITSP
jgi:dTDP-4-amino-4,6-dideoxygalactose transaminase